MRWVTLKISAFLLVGNLVIPTMPLAADANVPDLANVGGSFGSGVAVSSNVILSVAHVFSKTKEGQPSNQLFDRDELKENGGIINEQRIINGYPMSVGIFVPNKQGHKSKALIIWPDNRREWGREVIFPKSFNENGEDCVVMLLLNRDHDNLNLAARFLEYSAQKTANGCHMPILLHACGYSVPKMVNHKVPFELYTLAPKGNALMLIEQAMIIFSQLLKTSSGSSGGGLISSDNQILIALLAGHTSREFTVYWQSLDSFGGEDKLADFRKKGFVVEMIEGKPTIFAENKLACLIPKFAELIDAIESRMARKRE